MQVYLDEQGYVESYALVGTINNGIDVTVPSDLGHFKEHYQAYKAVNNSLTFDYQKEEVIELEERIEELRDMREKECFSYVDRSQFWYDSLSQIQLDELHTWYDAWLNVTETMIIPERPTWL